MNSNNGYQFALSLLAASTALIPLGSGNASLDQQLARHIAK